MPAWRDMFKSVLKRYPGYVFGGMLLVMLSSAIWMFGFKQRKPASTRLLSQSPKIALDTIGAGLPSITSTYAALSEVLDLQAQIRSLIDKDSLTSADSLLLIGALERFETIQKSMQLNNAIP